MSLILHLLYSPLLNPALSNSAHPRELQASGAGGL